MHLTEVILSKRALLGNIDFFRKIAPNSLFMAVVKSNAYGHGLEIIVEASAQKVDYWGVNSFHEAMRVRQVEQEKPVLVLSGNGYYELPPPNELLAMKIEFVMSSTTDIVNWIEKGYQKIPIHIKIDSGMGRLGVRYERWGEFCLFLENILQGETQPNIRGIMTHFSDIEDNPHGAVDGFARKQFDRFTTCIELLKNKQILKDSNLLYHSCSTSAAMVFPEARLNMIRIGCGLYGISPAPEIATEILKIRKENHPLQSVLRRWVGKIIHLQEIPADNPIGYTNTFITPVNMKVGVVGIGYFEGYSRLHAHKCEAIIHGQRVRILGAISMNMITIDLSQIKTKVEYGDLVIMLGQDEESGVAISSKEVAKAIGTIPREILSRLGADIPRRIEE